MNEADYFVLCNYPTETEAAIILAAFSLWSEAEARLMLIEAIEHGAITTMPDTVSDPIERLTIEKVVVPVTNRPGEYIPLQAICLPSDWRVSLDDLLEHFKHAMIFWKPPKPMSDIPPSPAPVLDSAASRPHRYPKRDAIIKAIRELYPDGMIPKPGVDVQRRLTRSGKLKFPCSMDTLQRAIAAMRAEAENK
jgi:hypothetical protein